MIIAFVITQDFELSLIFGPADFFGKLVWYYIHERLWYRVKWGIKDDTE